MTTTSIVLGAGGLLGSGVAKAASRYGHMVPSTAGTFLWSQPKQVLETVAGLVASANTGTINIFWCAGTGHVQADSGAFESARLALDASLEGAIAGTCPGARLNFIFSSSAGGVWSGCGPSEFPVTSETPPNPLNEYGRFKLEQEDRVRNWAKDGRCVVIARLSNLFGVSQDENQARGLVNALVANTIRNRPSVLYVPMDTARDYIPASEAAHYLVRLAGESSVDASCVRIAIVASGRTYTIAQVCSILARMRRKRVPTLHVANEFTNKQPRLLEFRPTRLEQPIDVAPLEVAVSELVRAERRRLGLAL